MATCRECGAPVPDEAQFCGSCGAPVTVDSTAVSASPGRFPSRRALLVIAGATAGILCAVAVLLWVLPSGKSAPATAAPTASPTPAPPVLTQDQATRLISDVSSGDAARVRLAIAMPADQHLEPDAAAQLAALHLTIDVTTFVVGAEGTGMADGTIIETGGNVVPVKITFVAIDGHWLLADASAR
jgi:hypothetical protein